MTDQPSIYKSDIGESLVFDWNCPECRAYNEVFEYEPQDGDTLHCQSCVAEITVIDD
jgi:hypothetical protein